ncbi:ORF3 [Sanxia Water Strider Virus 5]|uniref:ORF3 n=1 Tax=Sanxia Water Strider Virus 5 TaxID=1608064 RepID=UPI0005AD1FE5|nr:ORF3 [Sanxia Water Strider Virus 5]AJG39118.1 ORF3 [Sanxia Water Strider Virus 5]
MDLSKIHNQVSYTKVKGRLLMSFELTGLQSKSWSVYKYVCGLVILELFYNMEVSEIFLDSVISNLYQRTKEVPVTYRPSPSDSLLRGVVELKWFTASACFPTTHKKFNMNKSRTFPLISLGSQQILISYDFRSSIEPYDPENLIALLETGHINIEKHSADLHCSKARKQIHTVRKTTHVLNYTELLNLVQMDVDLVKAANTRKAEKNFLPTDPVHKKVEVGHQMLGRQAPNYEVKMRKGATLSKSNCIVS